MIDVIDCARFGGTGGQVVESCHNYCGSLDDFASPSGGGVFQDIGKVWSPLQGTSG